MERNFRLPTPIFVSSKLHIQIQKNSFSPKIKKKKTPTKEQTMLGSEYTMTEKVVFALKLL